MKTMMSWLIMTRRKTMVPPGGVGDDRALKMNTMTRWRRYDPVDRVLGRWRWQRVLASAGS